mmetsp:Transcript_10583/g.17316  ORF Transcript_10583/g.17316 Transcript_10583/m.17316 type:complete len:183 (+) Transcript_10583:56-604(+)
MGIGCASCCNSGTDAEYITGASTVDAQKEDVEKVGIDTSNWKVVPIGPMGTLNGKAPPGYVTSGNLTALGLLIQGDNLSVQVRFGRPDDPETLQEAVAALVEFGGNDPSTIEQIELADGYIFAAPIPGRHVIQVQCIRRIGGLRAISVDATANSELEKETTIAFCRTLYTEGRTKVFKRPAS